MTKKIHKVVVKIIADGKDVSYLDIVSAGGFDPGLLKTLAIGLMENFKANLRDWPDDMYVNENDSKKTHADEEAQLPFLVHLQTLQKNKDIDFKLKLPLASKEWERKTFEVGGKIYQCARVGENAWSWINLERMSANE